MRLLAFDIVGFAAQMRLQQHLLRWRCSVLLRELVINSHRNPFLLCKCIAALSQGVQTFPDEAVEDNDEERHQERGRQQFGKIVAAAASAMLAPRPKVLTVWLANWTYSETMLAFQAPPLAVSRPVIR